VKHLAALLDNSHLIAGRNPKNGICEVLHACAYVVGEFAEFTEQPLPIISALLQPRATLLPGHIQAVFVHNVLKV